MRTRQTPASAISECPTLNLTAQHYVRGHKHGPHNIAKILSVEKVSLSDVPYFNTDLACILKDIDSLATGQALKITTESSRSALTLRNKLQNACNRRGIAIRTSGRNKTEPSDTSGEGNVIYVWKGTTKRQKKVSILTPEVNS